jgi:hypothetical protein
MSQAEVAEQVNDLGEGFRFTQQVLAKIEGGKRPVRLREAIALAAVTRSSLDMLTTPRHIAEHSWRLRAATRGVRHWHRITADGIKHYASARTTLERAMERALQAELEDELAGEMTAARAALELGELVTVSENELNEGNSDG